MPSIDLTRLRDRWPWTRILTAAVLTGVLAAVLLTFRDYGISWDEEVQNVYGQKLLSLYASGFRDRSAFSYLNLYYYGGFFDLIAAIANLHSPFGVYQTRHLLGGLLMLAGLAGSWRLARLLAGERAAFLAVLVLALDPLMYGHSFINPKDAPLAWLSVWVIYYACRALDEAKPARGTVIGFGLSLGLALGTRVLAVDLIVYIAATLALCALAHRFIPDLAAPSAKPAAIALLAGLPIAYVTMAIFWPWAVANPLNPLKALGEFTNFPWKGMLLFQAKLISASHLPRYYLPLLLLYQLPEHTLAGLAMAVIAAIVALARAGSLMGREEQKNNLVVPHLMRDPFHNAPRRSLMRNGSQHALTLGRDDSWGLGTNPTITAASAAISLPMRRILAVMLTRRGLQYLLLLQAALVPIAAFVILRPTIYNGFRHFLFIVPPLGILAGIGWEYAFRWVLWQRPLTPALSPKGEREGPMAKPWEGEGSTDRPDSMKIGIGRYLRIPAGALLAAALAWELAVMVDLHPYEYVAYNRLAGGVAGASGRFELDYWDTSLAEASRDLVAYLAQTHQPQPTAVFICGNRMSAAAFLPKDTKITYDIAEADYFLSVVPSTCKWAVDVTKNRIIEVKRDGVTLGYVIDLKAGRVPAP